MSLYAQRGVSAQKEEVHQATEKLDKGALPKCFCKIYPDYLGGDAGWVNLMHADGAGTKSILAYLYWKETGDLSVWKGIARDAIAMNLDDLLCVGIYDNLLFSSTIDRNKRNIPGEVLPPSSRAPQEPFLMSCRLRGRHPLPGRRDRGCRRCGPDDCRERDHGCPLAKGPAGHQ
jgi:phosphoribosylformylglycinamidine cyclo-ligase